MKVNNKNFMQYALKLAKKGFGKVEPNPMVGCVIVKNNKIIGQGFHEYFGGPHAEINAINSAKDSILGAEMYVTMEPCSTWGKTPPCTDAIIKSGIKKVNISILDPNPLNRGGGIKKLQKNSIIVKCGLLSHQSKQLNQNYIKRIENQKRKVTVKAAMSLDGKIATHTGDSKWITSDKSRSLVHKMRAESDAIIVGTNTIIKDNPRLTSHGKGDNPVRVIIDPCLNIPLKSNFLDSAAPSIVFYSSKNKINKINILKKKKAILIHIPSKNNLMNFKTIINKLNKISLSNIFIEGGGETIASALKSGMVTDIAFFFAPIIIGGRQAKTSVEGTGIDKISNAFKLKNINTKKIGNDFMIKGKL